MQKVRKLPPQSERVETGAIQFGDDWPGLFIRGDDAFYYALQIRTLCERIETKDAIVAMAVAVLENVAKRIEEDVVVKPKEG